MAKLSSLAYNTDQSFKDLGYDSKYIFRKGSEAYVLWDDDDFIIVCRGTQPNKFEDILADIRLNLVPSYANRGRAHAGFKHSVDLLWPELEKLIIKYGSNRKIWCTGHSLGAAMATLITARLPQLQTGTPTLFTFGSPRVGDADLHDYLIELGVQHHRWVNNADMVTRNPVFPYRHHGILYYMNHHGELATMSIIRTAIDRIKGFITGIKKGKVNFFVNHFIENYINNIEKMVDNEKNSNS